MSALGHKRTFAVQNVMSALPPKADTRRRNWHVWLVPKADIPRGRPPAPLVGPLVVLHCDLQGMRLSADPGLCSVFAMRGYCLEAGLLVPRMKSCISSRVTKPSLFASIALKMRS